MPPVSAITVMRRAYLRLTDNEEDPTPIRCGAFFNGYFYSEVEIEAFDPTQYGMAARYDADGNFIYPEGFDPETQEWKPGFDAQREEWERQYQVAQERFLAHGGIIAAQGM